MTGVAIKENCMIRSIFACFYHICSSANAYKYTLRKIHIVRLCLEKSVTSKPELKRNSVSSFPSGRHFQLFPRLFCMSPTLNFIAILNPIPPGGGGGGGF